jgi:serine/threonine protein kinase
MVALKLVRASIEGPLASARFAAEREALARLSHPNVAAMYEAGRTAEGFPFFVMELVDGVPVTEYCDVHRLTIRQRLEVFIDICSGVQHAHQKGLIHRDLKPSNVLVVDAEGRPTPKVIDFGIAKALDHPLTDLRTRGGFIGTPGYMSPEALSGNDVDTRTDVYSLGVLLYELLAGTRPYRIDDVHLADIIRTVAEHDPLPLRTLFRTLSANEQRDVARTRGENETSLPRLLAGDLASIARKATPRERDTRYASAGEMAADITRYLRDEPVVATPPSFLYTARKFGRRHRAAVVAACAVMAAILAGTATTTIAMLRAQRAQSESRAVSQFLLDVLDAASPWSRKSDTTVRELLDEATARIPHDLKGEPAAQAQLLSAIGASQFHLGHLDRAERDLREALRLRIAIDGNDSPLVAGVQNDLGLVLKHRGELEGAERLLRQSLVIRERAFGHVHGSVARGLFDLGSILEERARVQEGEACTRESLRIRETLHARGDPDVDAPEIAVTLAGLGGLLERKGDLDEAERVLRRSIGIRNGAHDHGYAWARTMCELGNVLSRRGRAAEAEPIDREAVAALEAFVDPADARFGEAQNTLAESLRLQHKLGESEAIFQAVSDRFRIGGEQQVFAQALHGIANIRREEGRIVEAEQQYVVALAAFPKNSGYWEVSRRQTLRDYAATLRDLNRPAEAAAVEARAI